MSEYKCDFVTTLPLLKEKAFEYSDGRWNNYDRDVGEVLLKFLACTSHTVDYYYRQYLKNLLLPCESWTSRNLIWELTGFKPPYLRSDYLMAHLYWPKCGLLSYVPIYQYTPFKVIADGDEFTFMAAEDYLIPPKTSRFNIRLVNGTLKNIELEIDKVKDDQVKLSDTPIDYDLVTLTISGEKWRQVRNVFYEPSLEKCFSLHREEDGIYLRLHAGWKSQVDTYDYTGVIYFIESDDSFDSYTDDCISIQFAEPLMDTYGMDVSSFYRIHPMLQADTGVEVMPQTMEGDRVITTDDYTAEALLYPGVVTCKAYSWDTPSVVNEPLKVVLVAAGKEGMPLRGHTKVGLINFLQSIGSKNIVVDIMDPVLKKMDVVLTLDIGSYLGTLTEIQLRLLAKATVEEFFDAANLQVGERPDFKSLQAAILRADERILYVSISVPTPVMFTPYILPVLGNVIIRTNITARALQDSGEAREIIKRAVAVNRADVGMGRDISWPMLVDLVIREHPTVLETLTFKQFFEYDFGIFSESIDVKNLGSNLSPEMCVTIVEPPSGEFDYISEAYIAQVQDTQSSATLERPVEGSTPPTP